MSDLITEMQKKLEAAMDENNPYSYADFVSEFSTHTNDSLTDFKIQLKFVNTSNNPDPEYATEGSAGFDLRANLEKPLILKAGERALIPTGLFFEIPNNFEIQVRPRSGLALKNGITVLNSPGTVDSDYRGEVCVILVNLSQVDFQIEHGERIAQAIVATVSSKSIIELKRVENITTDTERGNGGFGSTGIK